MSKSKINVRKITMLAALSAVAYAVMFLSKQIPVSVLGFLNFDLKDVVICIAGFLYGPLAALGISIAVSLVEMVTVSSTGPWGLLMNVLSTGFFVCTAALIYRVKRTIKNAVIGLTFGVLLMTAAMLLWNYLITPLYMNVPREVVVGMLLPTFLPFNLIKGGINATLTLLIYKPAVNALRKARLVPPSDGKGQGGKGKIGVVIASAVLLITFVLLALVLAGVI